MPNSVLNSLPAGSKPAAVNMLECFLVWKTSIKRSSSSRSGNARQDRWIVYHQSSSILLLSRFQTPQSTTASFSGLVFRLCSLECVMVVIFWKMIVAYVISYISWDYSHYSFSLLSLHVVALGPSCRSKHELCLMLLYVCFSSSKLARCYTPSFQCWSCEKFRDLKSHCSIQNCNCKFPAAKICSRTLL